MKKVTDDQNKRMGNMTFASVFPHYITKVEKKGRTKEDLYKVIEWLTGYNEFKINELAHSTVTFKEFFESAKINPNANLITGVICGYHVEEIDNKHLLIKVYIRNK